MVLWGGAGASQEPGGGLGAASRIQDGLPSPSRSPARGFLATARILLPGPGLRSLSWPRMEGRVGSGGRGHGGPKHFMVAVSRFLPLLKQGRYQGPEARGLGLGGERKKQCPVLGSFPDLLPDW